MKKVFLVFIVLMFVSGCLYTPPKKITGAIGTIKENVITVNSEVDAYLFQKKPMTDEDANHLKALMKVNEVGMEKLHLWSQGK